MQIVREISVVNVCVLVICESFHPATIIPKVVFWGPGPAWSSSVKAGLTDSKS